MEDDDLFPSPGWQINIPFITWSVSSCSPVRKEVILRYRLLHQLRTRSNRITMGNQKWSNICWQQSVHCVLLQRFCTVAPCRKSTHFWHFEKLPIQYLVKNFRKNRQNLNGVIFSFIAFEGPQYALPNGTSFWMSCLFDALYITFFSGWPQHTGTWSYRL